MWVKDYNVGAINLSLADLAGVITLIVTILIYFKTRQYRALAAEQPVERLSRVRIADEIKSQIQVLYNGIPVQDVHKVSVKVANIGNTPLRAGEYDGPIRVRFEKTSQPVGILDIETQPKTLNIETPTMQGQEVLIKPPALMNRGDWILIPVLVNQFGGKVSIEAHVEGVGKIGLLNARRKFINKWTNRIVTVALTATIVAVIPGVPKPISGLLILFSFPIVAIYDIAGTVNMIQNWRKWVSTRHEK